MKKKVSQDKVVYFINYILLVLLLVIELYPLIYIVSCSFSSGDALMTGKVRLLPVAPTLDSYKAVFEYSSIWTGYKNSLIYTVVGTLISIVLTLFAAYPLSRDDFQGKKCLMGVFLFTMMFSGGLIPSYLLVKNLGLIDSMWSIILPGAVSAYNVIVARTYFKQTIPNELLEAAQMDGCEDFKFFQSIIPLCFLPLSLLGQGILKLGYHRLNGKKRRGIIHALQIDRRYTGKPESNRPEPRSKRQDGLKACHRHRSGCYR